MSGESLFVRRLTNRRLTTTGEGFLLEEEKYYYGQVLL